MSSLYVHDGHSMIDRPVQELKGFQRVELKPGESKKIQFTLDRAAFSYWSPDKKVWVAEPGKFEIEVGASSRDIRLRAPLEMPLDFIEHMTLSARRLQQTEHSYSSRKKTAAEQELRRRI